ncbi:hypothetical protein [Winogradskyella tangerina]|uniref:hypothetical protein n=1 Tax=Winogradskyella tangerina TaxID=2023240 RepID=UPI000DBE8DB6|nr:hypothetical protein [Winogradskyella tangerina]
MTVKTIIKPIYKALSLLLVVIVLLPIGVKLSHVFNHHEHEVCSIDDRNAGTHFHELDLDCEFFKFKLNTNFYSFIKDEDSSEDKKLNKTNTCLYIFLRTHQQTTSYLRGPPHSV